jgi:hypothetical protein
VHARAVGGRADPGFGGLGGCRQFLAIAQHGQRDSLVLARLF